MNINPFSCSSNGQNLEDENRPKLENFMGVHHQEQQKSSNYEVSGNENSYNNSIYQESEATSHSHSHSNNNNSSTIGLSMITNWLRNNPAPAGSKEAAPPAAQTLSLSMSTGSHSSSPLPSDTKIGSAAAAAAVVAVETAAATAIESVPRKSIDTFGQRTSIYRGVTRLIFLFLLPIYTILITYTNSTFLLLFGVVLVYVELGFSWFGFVD